MNGEKGTDQYEELTVKLSDVRVGDLVLGTDGQWKEVKHVYETFIPKTMWRLYFQDGWVECSGDHQWTVFLDLLKPENSQEYVEKRQPGERIFAHSLAKENNNSHCEGELNDQERCKATKIDTMSLGAVDTRMLPAYMEQFGTLHVGTPDGPIIISCEAVEPKPSLCVLVDNDDHQFEILLNPYGKCGVEYPEVENC